MTAAPYGMIVRTAALLCCGVSFSSVSLAQSKKQRSVFGAGYGLTFYTAPELAEFNARLGNSPRLRVANEFGRTITQQASYESTWARDVFSWGAEGQLWAETHRGHAASGETTPRSEATLAFSRLWMTGSVRLWPWVGPVFVRRKTNLLGFAVVMAKSKPLGSGLYSFLKVGTGPLLWRHDYLISDEENQTLIDYASRTLSWDGGVRLTLGWRLGSFCDVGVDLTGTRAYHVAAQKVIGNYFLSGRDSRDRAEELGVDALSRTQWQSTQALVFLRFFYP
jgi:hypothetical protein